MERVCAAAAVTTTLYFPLEKEKKILRTMTQKKGEERRGTIIFLFNLFGPLGGSLLGRKRNVRIFKGFFGRNTICSFKFPQGKKCFIYPCSFGQRHVLLFLKWPGFTRGIWYRAYERILLFTGFSNRHFLVLGS